MVPLSFANPRVASCMPDAYMKRNVLLKNKEHLVSVAIKRITEVMQYQMERIYIPSSALPIPSTIAKVILSHPDISTPDDDIFVEQ